MAEPLWTFQHPANLAFFRNVGFDPSGDSIYIASGHGQAFAAIRFLKVCARTGVVTAQARLGDEVRCWHAVRGEVTVATGKQLFTLQAESLEVVRQCRVGVPQNANHLVRLNDCIIFGCADDAALYVGEDTKPIRRRALGLCGLFPRLEQDRILVCAGTAGEIRSLAAPDAKAEVLHKTSPFFQASASSDANVLALSLKDRPRAPNRVLICLLEDAGVREETLELPQQFKRIQLSADSRVLCTFIDNILYEWEWQGTNLRQLKFASLPNECEILAVDQSTQRVVCWSKEGNRVVFSAFAY